MAGPERIEWRRGFPARAARRLLWYAGAALLVVAVLWLLFGAEPARLRSGLPNVLAAVPWIGTALAVAGGVAMALPVVRPARVAANHYALSVRSGPLRTLVLPWAQVDRVAVATTRDGRYLLIRCRAGATSLGPRPAWWDRSGLRAVARSGERGRRASVGYDLAVHMDEFAGGPGALMAAVAAFAPDHVVLTGEFDPA